ncbi:MAG: dethiobiotin synthase [Nocardioides sp.]
MSPETGPETGPGRVLVITGTNTEIGKTVATAALAVRAAAGGSVLMVKPVQTGIGPGVLGDAAEVGRLADVRTQEFTVLGDPLAPDTAARLRGDRIPPIADYVDRIRDLSQVHDQVIVEGAGGLLVRLDTDGGTILDLAALLRADIVIVTTAQLGTLNHTELTANAVRARGIEPIGLVIGSWPSEPGLAETCNAKDLTRVTGVPVIATIPAGAGTLDPEDFRAQAPTWFTS